MSSSRQTAELIERFRKSVANWHDRRAAQQGTTVARARLLQLLVRQGPSKMNDLSRLLDVTPRNVTKLVDRLESEGLVARTLHPQDRRATLISATPQGAALAEQAGEGLAAFKAVVDQLTSAEQAELRRLLEKLMQNLPDDGGSTISR